MWHGFLHLFVLVGIATWIFPKSDMPSRCCAPFCTNNSNEGYCFKEVPKCEELRKLWISQTENWDPPSSGRLCEVHFDSNFLLRMGTKKCLQSTAVPKHFCSCAVRQPLQPVQLVQSSEVLQNRILSDHQYYMQRSSLNSKENQSPCTVPKVTPTTPVILKKRIRNFEHSDDCPIKKRPPVPLSDLKTTTLQNLPEIVNSVDNITENVFESTRKKHESQQIKTLREKLNHLKEEKQALEKENKTLQKQVGVIQSELERAKCTINVLGTDQQEAVRRGTTRGAKWSEETIKKGLSLRLSCGSSGYESVKEMCCPLPSIRTLQEHIQCIKFEPGILTDVFECLSVIVPTMKDRDKFCSLVFDEMSIQSRVDYDLSSKAMIGKVTLKGAADELASKAVAFQLSGIGRHWKQYVAYEFTPSYCLNDSMKDIVLEILRRSKEVGLKVYILVCDMGNRGLLTALGFDTTRSGMVYKIPHPFEPDAFLYLMPDPVHVFKNLKSCVLENRFVTIPDDIKCLYELPTNVADMKDIEWLDNFQKENCVQLKYAPKLKSSDLKPTHFAKMKVSTSTNVMNVQTASALSHLVMKGEAPARMETTAWLVRVIRQWFDVMTGRTLKHALSFRNQEAHDNAISLLRFVSDLFRRLSIGNGSWKPSQTHVIMCSESLIEIQNLLLSQKDFAFFFPGRLTQDGVESGFSNIRRGRPKPSALDFKHRLRQLCIVGQDRQVSNASYSFDGVPSLLDLLLKKVTASDNDEFTYVFPALSECEELSSTVEQILYRMCGYVIFKLKKFIACDQCYLMLQDSTTSTNSSDSLDAFVNVTDYVPGAQIRASHEVFVILSSVERLLWKIRSDFNMLGTALQKKLEEHFSVALEHLPLSTCHNVKMKVIARFVSMRLRQMSSILTKEKVDKARTGTASAFGSRTMGASALADRFTGNAGRILSEVNH